MLKNLIFYLIKNFNTKNSIFEHDSNFKMKNGGQIWIPRIKTTSRNVFLKKFKKNFQLRQEKILEGVGVELFSLIGPNVA